ncbi:MAG: ATP-binding protein [Pseudomonadota bacterium]|nr:ATP-binding protein [Pseudomonadota bacterium]MDP1904392.1 ATP-binding protein [Pseudomonadota bacterium]MDP2354437.1 ATP-binding protein [Pseudomonadota bacterium]
MNSIRGRLLLWQISALLLTGLIASVTTYLLAWDAFNRVRDYGLEQIAYSVVRHGIEYENEEEVRNDHGQFVSQIWTADGSLFFSSLKDIGPPRQEPGLNIVEWENTEWHVFTLKEGGLTIQVANTSANRARRFADIAPWLLLPLGVLVVALALLIRAAVSRALAPLELVRGEIGRRGVQTLHALDSRSLPDEVAPLVDTLNDLLVRLDQALVSQRRFIADAAHELRTPLTAVKLQAQIARRAESAGEREAALDQLAGGVDRAAHLVDQLLGMARLEPAARQTVFAPLALNALVKQTVADLSTLAESRDIDLGVGECAALGIIGQAESLRLMLDNLIDNAVRYTPAGGRVDVEVRARDHMALISISDSGPGIPAAQRERVFERFQRLAGAEIPGSGLGLSIVKQVVDLHGGGITLDEAAGGGLKVMVTLPLP